MVTLYMVDGTTQELDVSPAARDAFRTSGGAGSGDRGHGGRKGSVGGSSAATDDTAHQTMLARAQTDPLAHPAAILGLNQLKNPLNAADVERYIAAYGRQQTAEPRPANIALGTPNQCFTNASLLVFSDPKQYQYTEGFASRGPLAMLHAWVTDKAGRVIDNTLPDPEHWKYFGVSYDTKKYLPYLVKAKFYGVLGSTNKNATTAMATGGKGLR